MRRLLPIFYALAILLHALVLFLFKSPAPHPPKIIEKTFIDVALIAPPPETPKAPTPPPVEPPPKPEIKPEPITPSPQPVMAVAEPKPEPPPPPKIIPPPVVTPPVVPPQPPEEYVRIAEPKYAQRAEPIYPAEARRRHQHGATGIIHQRNGRAR